MPSTRRKKPVQLEFPSHGGRRAGAGRPRGDRVSHSARPKFGKTTVIHVTYRFREHVWNLRSRRAYLRIRHSLDNSRRRRGCRVIEFSVQGNHIHFVIEADDNLALTRGMQGLAIRIAKALNALMRRSGKVFADHYHSRLLKTPTEVVRAIAYVIGNAARHFGLEGADPYCSTSLTGEPRHGALNVARSWMLRFGIRLVSPQHPPVGVVY